MFDRYIGESWQNKDLYTSHTKYCGVLQSLSAKVDSLTVLLDSVMAMQPSAADWPLAQLMGSLLAAPFFEHHVTALLFCMPDVHRLNPHMMGYPTEK
jgi:hypothetical protein